MLRGGFSAGKFSVGNNAQQILAAIKYLTPENSSVNTAIRAHELANENEKGMTLI